MKFSSLSFASVVVLVFSFHYASAAKLSCTVDSAVGKPIKFFVDTAGEGQISYQNEVYSKCEQTIFTRELATKVLFTKLTLLKEAGANDDAIELYKNIWMEQMGTVINGGLLSCEMGSEEAVGRLLFTHENQYFVLDVGNIVFELTDARCEQLIAL